jgi:DNA-binding response OmpR family regulator
MRFDIEGFITFDTEEASLVNLLTGDCIELSATSTRLLTNLLQYRGDIISRVDIFQSVFENMAPDLLIAILINTSQRCVAALPIWALRKM